MESGERNNVYKVYNKIAGWYSENRNGELAEKKHLDQLIEYLPAGAQVLDLGCGTGKPILAVDAFGMPLRVIITAGTVADCTQAGKLIAGLSAEHLLADRGYDSNAIIAQATKQGMQVQIPPKRNRKEQREYDKALYKARHLVENAFLHLKRWRGIATRYAKRTDSFLAAVYIRCIALWARVL